jgi:hypothetical protein
MNFNLNLNTIEEKDENNFYKILGCSQLSSVIITITKTKR